MKNVTFYLFSSLIILLCSCSNPDTSNNAKAKDEEKNLAEANKELIRNYFKAIDVAGANANADTLDNFLSEDLVEHNPFPGLPANRDGWKQVFLMFAKAAPGSHVIDDLIAEGDKVVARVTAHGKHIGTLFGIPATNKDFSMTGISIWRIKNGKIVEHWRQTDQVGMMTQLGVMPQQKK